MAKIQFGKKRIHILFLIAFFVVLSVLTVVCETIYKNGSVSISSASQLAFLIAKIIVFTLVFLALFKLMQFGTELAENTSKTSWLSWSKKDWFRCAFFLFLIYLVYLIIFYPGVCNYDTTNEIYDLISGSAPIPFDWIGGQVEISVFLNDHHPIFDTLLFGLFYKIGGKLGGYNIGVFIYVLYQAVLTSAVFSTALCVLDRFLKKAYYFQVVGFVYFAAMPFISLYVINMVKDSLYAMIFVAYFIVYLFIIKEGVDKKKLALLIILSVLQVLTKKTGVYAVLICNVVLLFLPTVRKNLRHFVGVLASMFIPALLIFVIFSKILFPALNIYPGGKQEMLGLCFQQAARVVVEHEEELSDDERVIIANVIDYDGIRENYNLNCTDSIKDTYNYYATDEEIKDFIRLWISLGLRYPMDYIYSVIGVNGGYFAPVSTINVYRQIANNELGLYNVSALSGARDFVINTYTWITENPVFSVLFFIVTYAWWIPVFILVYLFEKRDRHNMLCMVPILVSILFLIVSPLTTSRYVLPQLYTMPLVVGLLGRSRNNSSIELNGMNDETTGVV